MGDAATRGGGRRHATTSAARARSRSRASKSAVWKPANAHRRRGHLRARGSRVERALARGPRADLELATTSDGDKPRCRRAARIPGFPARPTRARTPRRCKSACLPRTTICGLVGARIRLARAPGRLVSIDGPVTRTRVASADTGWSSRACLGAWSELRVRRFDDAYVETRAFTYDDATCRLRLADAV